MNLPRSTAHRLLTTMGSLRYIEFDPSTRRWVVGVRAFTLGNAYSRLRGLPRLARPLLRALQFRVRDTVSLAIPVGGTLYYAAQLEGVAGRGPLRPGQPLPFHATAVGKAFLAHLSASEVDALLGDGALSGLTPASRTTAAEVAQDLHRVRAEGVAFDDEECMVGLRCVAAPVFNACGQVCGALSVSGHADRMSPERMRALAPTIDEAARGLASQAAGWALE